VWAWAANSTIRSSHKLTERGKGAYVFLGSEAEVDAVFGRRFISLFETNRLDVTSASICRKTLRMKVFYGEESSTVKEQVQQIPLLCQYLALFLSDLEARRQKNSDLKTTSC